MDEELKPKKYCKLRIAWSVGCGIVALLLCVLWARSYSQFDVILKGKRLVGLTSAGTSKGSVYVMRVDQPYTESDGWYYFTVYQPHFRSRKWFDWARPFGGFAVQLPTCVLVLTSSVVAVAPWLPFKRFSLRTLLIATTLVAVVLGVLV